MGPGGGTMTRSIARLGDVGLVLRLVSVGVCLAVISGCGGSKEGAATVKKKPAVERPMTPQQIVARSASSTAKLYGRYGESIASGSGAVIDAEQGLILTNAHVVAGVEALKAQTGDSPPSAARVVAQAPCEDIALVKLVTPPSGLTAFKLGSSAAVKSGEHVSVLGYPQTLEQTDTGSSSKLTYTGGTVSNPDTSATLGDASPKYTSLIQHQAPVNHGNSGGPLVDDYGRLLGLNTLTGAGSDEGNQTQGQYYAIAIDRIKTLLPTLKTGTSISDFGWSLQPVSTDLLTSYYGADAADLTNAVIRFLNSAEDTDGLMVLGTDPGSSAERNHFTVGDYVTAINETPVTSVADVCDITESKSPGQHLRVHGRLLSKDTPSDNFGDEFDEDMLVPKR
jgi:S1-C subfamily serine protease